MALIKEVEELLEALAEIAVRMKPMENITCNKTLTTTTKLPSPLASPADTRKPNPPAAQSRARRASR